MEFVRENLRLVQATSSILFVLIIYCSSKRRSNAPLVGVKPGILGSLKTPYRWMQDPMSLLKEGAEKYGKYGKAFRITTPARDIIVFSSQEVLQELKSLPASVADFRPAGDEMIRSEYNLHEGLVQDAYHVDVMRKNMTEKLSSLLPDIVDEITDAFEGLTDIKNEWTNINVLNISIGVISRATQRIFVGVPTCRSQEYLDGMSEFSLNAMGSATIIDVFPWFLRWIVARFFLKKNAAQDIVVKHIAPLFEARKRAEMPNAKIETTTSDAIQWILDAAPPGTPTFKLVQRLMFFNFTALHTSSITLAHVLYDLAANPEFQDPICTEVEEAFKTEGGWTKQALTKMKKLDSVLRESSRMNGAQLVTVVRKVITPHTFVDGTYAPKGAWVCSPAPTIHYSPDLYENPATFDGFRFYRMRQEEGNAHNYQMASPGPDYLPFGLGRYSCPGRFFATNELKIAVAYILCNYRLRLNGGVGGKKPPNVCSGIVCLPNPAVGIEMKEREGRENSVLFPGHVTSHKR